MYKVLKRIIDFCTALIMGIILFIPLLIVAICIKIDSKGPVFFKQERVGKNGEIFKIYKFRTMVANNGENQKDTTTKFGNFLRKTSIDELGQIINILKGEMSFVGPRAWMPEYYDYMTEEQKHRYDVVPGITGLAQVHGRNDISVVDRINYDLSYIQHLSLIQDIKICFLTLKVLFTKCSENEGKRRMQNEIDDLKQYKESHELSLSEATAANENYEENETIAVEAQYEEAQEFVSLEEIEENDHSIDDDAHEDDVETEKEESTEEQNEKETVGSK